MNKFYLLMAIFIAIFFAFYAGKKIGIVQCVHENINNTVQQQLQIVKIKEKINEDVFNTDTDDIRRVLRQKYSIAK